MITRRVGTMVERDDSRTGETRRPLLAYAPEFLAPRAVEPISPPPAAAVMAEPKPAVESAPKRKPATRPRWAAAVITAALGGLAGAGLAALAPPHYLAGATLQVSPPEKRSEIASRPVLDAAARLAHVETPADLGPMPPVEALHRKLAALMGRGPASPPPQPVGGEALRPHLDFRQSLDSGAITVEASAASPQTAALIANAVAQAFRDQVAGDIDDLPDRLHRLEAEAASAKAALAAFRASHDFGEEGEAQQAFAAAKAETARIQAGADALADATPDSLAKNGVPEALRSGALGPLVERYGKGEKALAPQITAEIVKLRAGLQAELKGAVEREQKLAAASAAQNPAGEDDRKRLQELERDAEARQALYEDLQMRAARGESASGATVRVLSAATPDPKPHGVSPGVAIPAGVVLGGLLGLLAALLGRRPRTEKARVEEARAEPEPLGETPLAAAIREANARWEAEHGTR